MTVPNLHEIHVAGWDEGAILKLVCKAPGPGGQCWLVSWWENVDPSDLIHGPLLGPPPWPVETTWSNDGSPQLRPAP